MRLRHILVGFTIALVLASHGALAGNCAPTPKIATSNYPGAAQIPFGNNLLQPAGKAVSSDGQKLTILGRVVDNHCVPISGATVELWQANPFGRFALATPAELVTAGPTFVGAGRATTDNDGNFFFITAFPAGVGKRAPNVNIKVLADGLDDFSTVLYFGDDKRNNLDDDLKKISGARDGVSIHMQAEQGDGLIGSIQLVLPQKAPYRTY